MKKLFIFILLFVACCTLVIFSPAYAGMTNESYAIPSLTVSSGGAPSLESTGYRLHDLKGQGVIGVSTKDAFTAELGGLYGEIGAAVVERPGLPWGSVPLYISRQASDIKITWEADFVNPQIYVLTGKGSGEYVNTYDTTKWVRVASAGALDPLTRTGFTYTSVTRTLLHTGQVGGGSLEAYYKGIQATRAPTEIIPGTTTVQCFTSAEAVGKVNVQLNSGWNLAGMPFNATTREGAGNLDDVLGVNIFAQNDMVWIFNGGFRSTSFSGTNWPGSISLVKGKGFWLYMGSAAVLTLAGPVYRGDFAKQIVSGWNLLADPFPSAFDLTSTSSGLNNPVRDDQIWWYRGGFSSISAAGDPASWPSGKSIRPGAGFWYYRNSDTVYNWRMTLP